MDIPHEHRYLCSASCGGGGGGEVSNPNPFAPLPPPAIFSSAYHYYSNDEKEEEAEEEEAVVIDLTLPASTPPIVLRDDQFECLEITQEEFLEELAKNCGWTPVAINSNPAYHFRRWGTHD